MSKKLFLKMVTFICFLVNIVLLNEIVTFADEFIPVQDNVIKSWAKLTPRPIGGDEFGVEVVNGKIYAIGGRDILKDKVLTDTDVYDPTSGTWTKLAPMPTSRYRFSTLVLDGKIYTFGGISNGKYVPTVESYDPSSNSWTKLAPMKDYKLGFGLVVLNGKIYVAGGRADGSLSSKELEVYDPSNNSWSKLASMNEGRASFGFNQLNGKIYAIGGTIDGSKSLSSTEVYDPLTNKWTVMASMNESRYSMQTHIINEKIYAFGGTSNTTLTSTEVYDPTSNTWSQLAPLPESKSSLLTRAVGGKVYAFTYSKIEVYNPASNTWKEGAIPNNYRYDQVAFSNGKIYLMSSYYLHVYITVEDQTNPDDNSNPSKLIATAGDSKVELTWPTLNNATSYTVKRSTTSGGPYAPIATNISSTSYTDADVINGTTYYYIVSVIKDGIEIWNSNEASATPKASDEPIKTGKQALLVITMENGERKEYDLPLDKINEFLNWYNNNPVSNPIYVIEKNYNKASFTSRKDYISFNQISSVEVNEYEN
jgi:N-acetylneuraminic acid mutarotase